MKLYNNRKSHATGEVIEAIITVSQWCNNYGVVARLYQRGQALQPIFQLLTPDECSSEQRAWYSGYQTACDWAEQRDARIIIREGKSQRRAAA